MIEAKTKKAPGPGGPAAHDFVLQMQQFSGIGGGWGEVAREQLERWSSLSAQMQTWQEEGVQRLEEATDEAAKLFKRSVAESRKLAEQWQSTAMEAAHRALDMVAPRT